MYVDPWSSTQPVNVKNNSRRSCCFGCGSVIAIAVGLILVIGLIGLLPGRTNVLVIGIDRAPEGTSLGRSDTIILATFVPINPYVGMLSIPRDLWVTIPGIGENRINTAHFFAESEMAGQGPQATMETVRYNFGIDVNYFIRVNFEGLKEIVDAMGGLELELENATGGYSPGKHKLKGDQALAFVRDREGTDDFFRMERGQLFIKSVLIQSLKPATWLRLPAMAPAILRAIDTNLPVWQLPRMAVSILITGTDNIDNRVITRDMVHPTTTAGGAQVLIPDWPKINPVLLEMFGQ
ncbi:MAG: LCP family protein [Anaerolineales bacterium]|nr:LCP family protein [Anaerolineales bacterium]